MTDYTFSTLNDEDLEKLARDLLNAEFSWSLQNFKSGRDGGIDLRESTPTNSNRVVVQVKHYPRSGYKKLLATLKTDELDKVNELSPDRYIVVTSLPLSASEKDEIRVTMAPYILTSDEVFEAGNEIAFCCLVRY